MIIFRPNISGITTFYYISEACGLNKADLHSLDFAVNRFQMKLFKTANFGIIKDCLIYFEFKLPSVQY
jgi:hypothetical protein